MTGRSLTYAAPAVRPPDLHAVLQIGLLGVLAYACARIVLPFANLLLWSVTLAVMLHPLHLRLARWLGNRWSAVAIGAMGVILVLAPMVLLAASVGSFTTAIRNHTLTVPPPPARLATLPLVGAKLTAVWDQVAANTPAALAKYGPTLKAPLAKLLSSAGHLAATELSFVLALGIAAVLVAYAGNCAEFARRLVQVVTGSRSTGARLVALTAATIRGVAVGIVGVAAIQAACLGAGFFAIGLSGAGVLTLVVMVMGILQLPATLLTLPVIAYVFMTEPVGPAAIFAVWTLVAGLSDNVLKPLMLGRGLEIPMPVILVGVIGGLLADGLLGLFVGPVLLSIGYVLFVEWLREQPAGETAPLDSAAA